MDEIRTVRALIARQDFYRAASAQVALLFGSISFIISFAVLVSPALFLATNFIGAWMCVFAAAAITAGALLRRDAKKRGERSRPERRRMVLTTISPPLLAGGAVTVAAIVSHIQPLPLAGFWMLFYGLVLLSTRLFAP